MTTTRPHGPDCCEVTDPPAYLDPVRDELDRLRTENADLNARAEVAEYRADRAETRNDDLEYELDLVRDTLRHRSNALNATGTHNDQLRATLAKADKWADLVIEAVEGECKATGGMCHGFDLTPNGCALVEDLNHLRAILADKEPTP